MIGKTLSHYRIVDKLGEGAMGVVYKAVDTRLDRAVALKVLPKEALADPERKRRFIQEARAASALNHPNIITIHEIDSDQGVEFIAMEYIRGRTLDEVIGRKGMSVGDALKYGVQIADAMGAAHSAGIVHRDLKPANIMVNDQGLVKVLDFGVAKLTDPLMSDAGSPTLSQWRAPAARTLDGTIIGTIAYMSPEQAQGRKVDARSDIFSMGSVLYEMVTGRRAFRGDSPAAIFSAILRDEPPPASTLAEGMPEEMEAIVNRCLRKEPERRYQGAAELKVVLQELSDERRLGGRLPARRRPARRWGWAAAGAAAVALGILVAPAVRERAGNWSWLQQVPAQKHIAVLPFQNIGGEPAHQAFCDGLAETLASKLAQLEQFHGSLLVVPAGEVRREAIAGAREAQRAFGVNLVITGSVQRAGSRVRLTANLIDARSLRQLGARDLDTQLEDLASLQDGVVAQVASLLELELRPQARRALAAGNTSRPGAYDLYLQGRGNLLRYDRPGNLDAAIVSFQQALVEDPGYALAHAGLAEAYLRQFRRTKDLVWIDRALGAATRALELNDRLAAAHVSLAVAQAARSHQDAAIQQLHRALEIDPVNADAYRELANVYQATGRVEDAEKTYKRAIQLRPSDWQIFASLGSFYHARARYPEAEAPLRRVIEITPDNSVGYRNLGALYHSMGRYEEAGQATEKSLALKPDPVAYTNLGTIYYYQARYRDGVAANEKAIQLTGTSAYDYIILGNLGDCYRWTPELADKAADAYRRAIAATERHLEINPNDARVLSIRAACRAKLAENKLALEDIARALKLAPASTSVLFRSAIIHELTNQRPRALAALEAGLAASQSIEEVRREPELAQLRRDPNFQGIADRFRPAGGSRPKQP